MNDRKRFVAKYFFVVIASLLLISLGDYSYPFETIQAFGKKAFNYGRSLHQSSGRPAAKYNIKWVANVGNYPSEPALANDGTLYVVVEVGPEGDKLVALSPSGSLSWKCQIGRFCKWPVVAQDGTVYVGCGDGLYALRENQIVWQFPTLDRCTSPAIGADGTLYVQCQGGSGAVFALTPQGIEKWSIATPNGAAVAPVVGPNGIVYIGHNVPGLVGVRDVHALTANGIFLWSYRYGDEEDVIAALAVDGDGTVYVSDMGNRGNVYAVNNGIRIWKYDTRPAVKSSASIGLGREVYIASGGNWWQAEGGHVAAVIYNDIPGALGFLDVLWSYDTPAGFPASPVVGADGTVYGFSETGCIWAAPLAGGYEYASPLPPTGRIYSSPAIGPDGTLYVTFYGGFVAAIETPSKGAADSDWPMFQHDARRTGNWATPQY